MSDHIEVDGRKYFEQSYLQGAVASAKRNRQRAERAEAEVERLKNALYVATLQTRTHSDQAWIDRVERAEAENARLRERVETLEAALRDARAYVYGAYECAFPDPLENERVLREVDAALVAKEATHAAE